MKNYVLLGFFCLCCLSITAQQSKKSFGQRLVFGGGLGAQFGDVTIIEVAPTIGYKVTDNLIAGLGGKYIYLNDKFFNYKTNIYGGSVFTQYYFLQNFVAHSEVEVLNLEVFDQILDKKAERRNVTSVLVGGGVRFSTGTNSAIIMMILWNLNETIYSPYANPIFRFGFAIGI